MNANPLGPHARPRPLRGFTLVELLVVITIIGMLVALLIPAVGAARARARQAQCQQNLSQVGKAMINYSTSKQRYPGYVQPVERSDKSYLTIDLNSLTNSTFRSQNTSTDGPVGNHPAQSLISWAAIMLPQLERNDIYDTMLDAQIPAAPTDERANIRPIESLICPADSDLLAQPNAAGMTYVVNSGAWDYSGTTSPNTYLPVDKKASPPTGDTKENGLCHNLTLGEAYNSSGAVYNRPGKIDDGADYTIMLSENVHKEIEEEVYTWMGVDGLVSDNSLHLAEQVFGMVWMVDPSPTTTNSQAPFSAEDPRLSDGTAGAYQTFVTNLPYYARPASTHPGGVFTVVMAGGSARTLAPDLDYVVYQQLLTPKGSKSVDPADHDAFGGAITTFRTAAPIAASDLE